MLNLFDPVHFDTAERTHVDSVLLPLKSDGWADQKIMTKAIKTHISAHTIIAQGGRCAYCESPLSKGALAIEHIAPKGLYGWFCFEPFNLVTACSSCNSTANKGEKDTVVRPVNWRDYSANKFKIVHPYFDDPARHFKFFDVERTMFDTTNCSSKGQATIAFFNWNQMWAYYKRVVNARTRDLPMDVLKLVEEIVTYK